MPRGVSKAKAKSAEADKEKAVDFPDESLEVESLPELGALPMATGKSKAAGSRKAAANLADELEEMTRKMNTISLEKEKAELLLKERDLQLEQKNAEELRLQSLLEAKELEQEKLTQKVRELQKIKEFKPTIDLPANISAAAHTKRPHTPFMLWAKEQRAQVRKEQPEATFTEISRILGERWKAVSEEEKKPYKERYDAEKAVYLDILKGEKRDEEALKFYHQEQNKQVAVELLEQYLKFKGVKGDKDSKKDADKGKKKKKEIDPTKPRGPTSAFFVFSNERRPALLAEHMKIPEIGRQLGEEWKALDEKSREPYEKIAEEDKARYDLELEAYKLRKAGERKEQDLVHKALGMQLLKQREQIDQVKKSLKEEKPKKNREKKEAVDPNKPKKPLNSYMLFVVENRKIIQEQKPSASFAELTATLAVRWQELPESEKQIWTDKAAAARDSYKAALDEYTKTQEPQEPLVAVK